MKSDTESSVRNLDFSAGGGRKKKRDQIGSINQVEQALATIPFDGPKVRRVTPYKKGGGGIFITRSVPRGRIYSLSYSYRVKVEVLVYSPFLF